MFLLFNVVCADFYNSLTALLAMRKDIKSVIASEEKTYALYLMCSWKICIKITFLKALHIQWPFISLLFYTPLNNCWCCHSKLEDGAKIVGLIPIWAIQLRVGLAGPCGCLPAQILVLWFWKCSSVGGRDRRSCWGFSDLWCGQSQRIISCMGTSLWGV